MSKDKPATQTFADYEVITPVNQLRHAVSSVPLAPGDDPVARAERALQDLSGEFAGWMQTECERLDQARHEVKRQGFNTVTKEAIFTPRMTSRAKRIRSVIPA